MKTLINFEINENELCDMFITRRKQLAASDIPLSEILVTKFSDGIIYTYETISSITTVGSNSNKVFQVIIADSTKTGVTVLDTKTISRTYKKLTGELQLFFTALHDIIVDPKNKDVIRVVVRVDHTIADFREQLLIDNAQEHFNE